MKLIPLTQGMFTEVDDEDYEWLSKYKWFAVGPKGVNKFYASTLTLIDGVRKQVKMHRLLMGVKDSSVIVDHVDRIGLNNQKNNLRICTHKENSANMSPVGTSKYKGVSKCSLKTNKRWMASIKIDNKTKRLGYFPYDEKGEIEAALAYNEAVKQYRPEFGMLNDVENQNKIILKPYFIPIKKEKPIFKGIVPIGAKLIPITKGKFALVDEKHFDYINTFKWAAEKQLTGNYYAVYRTRLKNGTSGKRIYMHRLIMKACKGQIVDHKDGDGLNNQSSNLRFCTRLENSRNRKSKKNSSSKYLGVSRHKHKLSNGSFRFSPSGYIAQIKIGNDKIKIGKFINEIDAAKAYDEMAKIHFGEFANLNFKE